MNSISNSAPLEGQLTLAERNLILEAVTSLLPEKPICLEVGTYKGGGGHPSYPQSSCQG